MASEEVGEGKRESFIQRLREDPVKLALLIVAILSLITTIYFGTRSKGTEAEKMTTHMTMDSTPTPNGSPSERAVVGGYDLGAPLNAPAPDVISGVEG